jgi:MFS transporter, DHA3 family, multidrug efflux protein
MKTFYAAMANSLIATLTNTFIWFALTFWVFLQTQSVITTSVMAGIYTAMVALSGFVLGSLVDRYRKKLVMLLSSVSSLVFYTLAGIIFVMTPSATMADPASVQLWLVILCTLIGVLVGNLRGIALSTLVTILVPADERDRANGLVGAVNGVAFLLSSVFSGLVIGLLGAGWMFGITIGLTVLAIMHLATLTIPDLPRSTETSSLHPDAAPASEGVDIRGTLRAIQLVPGLLGLIFFHTFNNFLGGIFMSLMDAYGLLLVSVQVWGILWGALSLGFIVGGLVVARRGLGKNPLKTLFLANIAMWTICVFFTIQASIVLLTIGMFVWLCLIPAVEAAEQTILQRVVPPERQGRVFGFAQSVEQAASPVMSFVIGPVAQLIFIPFMTTGAGVELLGSWFGTGTDRGIALLFTVAGVVGLAVTLLAMRSRAYRVLSGAYQQHAHDTAPLAAGTS